MSRQLFEALAESVHLLRPFSEVQRTRADRFVSAGEFVVTITDERTLMILCAKHLYMTIIDNVAVHDGYFTGTFKHAKIFEPDITVVDTFKIPQAFPWHIHGIPRNRYDELTRAA